MKYVVIRAHRCAANGQFLRPGMEYRAEHLAKEAIRNGLVAEIPEPPRPAEVKPARARRAPKDKDASRQPRDNK